MSLEMISCGKCSKCLIGGRVHGPYQYRWKNTKERRLHLYGDNSGNLEGDKVTGDVADRMRAEALEDAEEREHNLTALQLRKRDEIMALLAKLRSVSRYERIAKKAGDVVEGERLGREVGDIKERIKHEKKALKESLEKPATVVTSYRSISGG